MKKHRLPSPFSNSLFAALIEWLWARESLKRAVGVLLLLAGSVYKVVTGRWPW